MYDHTITDVLTEKRCDKITQNSSELRLRTDAFTEGSILHTLISQVLQSLLCSSDFVHGAQQTAH